MENDMGISPNRLNTALGDFSSSPLVLTKKKKDQGTALLPIRSFSIVTEFHSNFSLEGVGGEDFVLKYKDQHSPPLRW